ncbi:MAG: ABC transporter ATP-binding protein [Bacilli bacterium]|nr:ABC transporter ATP-binding protein [Bacilli bacterium]
MKNKATLKFINDNIKGKKITILILSLTQILLGVLTVGFSFMLRYIIDSIEKSDNEKFVIYVIILSIIALFLIIFQIFYRLYFEYSAVEIENKLKDNLYKTILGKEYQEIKKMHEEEWIHRLTSDTNIIASSILSILPSLCRMVVQLALALAAIIYLFPIFGLSLIPFIVFILLITYLMRKRLKALHHNMQEKDARVKVFFSESLQGLSIIHSFVKEDIFTKREVKATEEYKKARLKRNYVSALFSVSYVAVYYAAYVLGIFFAGNAILEGTMTTALLTALVALLTQLTGPLGNLTAIIPRYYSLIASGERLRIEASGEVKYLNEKEIEEYYATQFKGIEIKNLSYSYLDKYGNKVEALKNFNLEINKGDKILIKGHSGSGKSTLFKILLSLISPDSGSIVLKDDGEAELSKTHEKLFAYVPQDNLLMEGTIEEVITLFDECVDVKRLQKAIKISNSEEFINELALKEKTYLNEKGSGLSLGQMERIAIARAIYSDAPILLLDECSASLDAKNEEIVMSNILDLGNKTVVLISHHDFNVPLFNKVIDLGE